MELRLTLPNCLTLFRIFSIAPILWLLQEGYMLTGALLMGAALSTDFLDGKIARKMGSESQLGALLDPIADKLIILAFFSFFAFHGTLNITYFIIAATRDTLQLAAIPILLAWKKIPFKVKPKLFAKIGTAIKFGIVFLLCLSWIPCFANIWESSFTQYAIYLFAAVEFIILVTFIKRFYEIYNKQHDTFE